ncbi:serine hydrolase domain-containing protein [Mucilaginibacter glaciei]|uniref:Beta-lactamase family protein n=1 Tax=Mucilaginibacter glaciei TaxID=2772109 RepID=A0A926S1C4_9SPHI|nr:serine hydrolase domain-containing protein [Mucilaginibacter glaciei]MBD1392652.1 beta-lactamase family protein [Mucilaginibacter glaciei]
MIKKLSILIGIQILSLNWLQAQSKKDFQQAQFENSLQLPASFVFADSVVKKYNILERMSYHNIPSVSIAVIDNGKVVWAKAYGYSNDSLKIPATINTMYQAASISKSVNAICIIKLVQDGKLSLTMDIRQYLKTWKFPDNGFSKGKDITLSNLLSHTAGLGTSGFIGYPHNSTLPNTDQMLDGMAPANSEAVKPVIAPNTKWLYSGGGTLITKKILNDNISADYAALLMQQVLKPLKMQNSTFEQPLPARYKDHAIAYNNEKKPIPGGYNVYPEQAPDGLWTTPTDYAQFILSVQSSLAGKKSLLNKAMAEVMLKPVLAVSNAALGVNVKEVGGEKYFFHSGTTLAIRASIMEALLPEKEWLY